ncbi:MAG TPA: NRDE family protein, partial [Rhodocyclaceae bacterium]|nr:NRDE family protein [Rhodocyclaceae bacterium]
FAALTNFRAPERHRDGLASRGRLVADFLAAKEEPMPWLQALASRTTEYNDFNLIVSDGDTLAYLSSVTSDIRLLEAGVHGLSNHLLDTPWPKVQAAKSALSDALVALPDDAPLLELLRDDSVHPDEALPRTGVSLEWERLLSAAFVRAPGYGTRSSTILLVGADRRLTFDEQTWLEDSRPGGRARFRLRLTAS